MSVWTRAAPPPAPPEPLLDRLWPGYLRRCPYAAVFAALSRPARVHNDHVAFRTLAEAGGIERVAAVFERRGWRRSGSYDFPDTHIDALSLSRPGFPRIFISQLHGSRLPAGVTAHLRTSLGERRFSIDAPPQAGVDELAAWFDAAPAPPTAAALDEVAAHSQYGAWLLLFGRQVNHFTGAVDDVEAWQARMGAAGVPMKSAIEGAPGAPLRQTATAAAQVEVRLADGSTRQWPYAYFEIAERRAGFDGFLGPQARQLFEMTRR